MPFTERTMADGENHRKFHEDLPSARFLPIQEFCVSEALWCGTQDFCCEVRMWKNYKIVKRQNVT